MKKKRDREQFYILLKNLFPSSSDRRWVEEEGWERFHALLPQKPILLLEHHRAWTRALFRVARSPSSGAPATNPEDYHLKIVYAFGSRGARLLRLRRQVSYFRIPWTEKDFVECTRIAGLHRQMKERPRMEEIDCLWQERSLGTVARQLITIFTGDIRIEQQKDFSGEISLRRALEMQDGGATLFQNIEDAFLGREETLLFLQRSLENSLEKREWRVFSNWMHLAAERFCTLYDLDEEERMSQTLLEAFWELESSRQKERAFAKRALLE